LLRKCCNLPTIAVIGCAFTLATQIALMIELDEWPFIAVWNFGKLFGFLSTLASSFMITEVAPKSQLGYWNGLNGVFSNMSQAISPLIFSAVYDGVGNVRGQEMLVCTSVVSFLAMVAYVPLIGMMPKPPKEVKLELQDMAYYEGLSNAEWSALPMEIVDQVTAKMLEAGKLPQLVSWGDYDEERPRLYDLQARAAKDFQYLQQSIICILSDREKLVQEQKNFKTFMDLMPRPDREKAKSEMGAWIASYFDDAGYLHWETQTPIYKAMIMTAFPPIDKLDAMKPKFETMPVEQFEENVTKVLQVMDSHLAIEQRRIRNLGGGVLSSLLRRR